MNQILVFLLVFVIGTITGIEGNEDKNLSFRYDGLDQQESLKDYFDIAFDDIKLKEGSDSVFIINGKVEQKLDLDDEWKAHITVYRSDTVDGDYTEFLKFPEFGSCAFMQSIYKKYFYPTLKECSNLPDPGTCPITKEKYWSKCEFDANIFRKFSKPGFYRIKTDLSNNDEIKTGVIVRGSVFQK